VGNNVPSCELAFAFAACEEVLVTMGIHVLFLVCHLVEAGPAVFDWTYKGLLTSVDPQMVE
jgi:hypothetical protein